MTIVTLCERGRLMSGEVAAHRLVGLRNRLNSRAPDLSGQERTVEWLYIYTWSTSLSRVLTHMARPKIL